MQGELLGLGSKDRPFNADEVADIELLEEFKGLIANDVLPEVSLNPSLSILNLDKTGFPEISDSHESTRDPKGLSDGFQLFVR